MNISFDSTCVDDFKYSVKFICTAQVGDADVPSKSEYELLGKMYVNIEPTTVRRMDIYARDGRAVYKWQFRYNMKTLNISCNTHNSLDITISPGVHDPIIRINGAKPDSRRIRKVDTRCCPW
jgi:hypothetical protein